MLDEVATVRRARDASIVRGRLRRGEILVVRFLVCVAAEFAGSNAADIGCRFVTTGRRRLDNDPDGANLG